MSKEAILVTVYNQYRSSPPEVFCKKGVLRNFAKFKGKYLQAATLLKKRLWHRYFPVNFAKFLRTLFFTEHFQWLFLNVTTIFQYISSVR